MAKAFAMQPHVPEFVHVIASVQGGRDPLIGAKAVGSFLMFATATGVLLAIFLNTAGGAWDNVMS